MKLTIWGSRGSIASAGPRTVRYGGNTACVTVEADDGTAIVLDAGTGMRPAGIALAGDGRPLHVLITHLHMDHIQGLGFFRPLFEPGREIHIWGPPSTTLDLRTRLSRYLSPPLFPVRIHDLDSRVELHDVPAEPWQIGSFRVTADSIIHPGATVGYRIDCDGRSMGYLPDHEPALGGGCFDAAWTSGHDLVEGVDLLLHDAQYTPDEYKARVGWGHSSVDHAAQFADLAGVNQLVLFHHEPDHDDDAVDALLARAVERRRRGAVDAAREGSTLRV